MFYKLLQSIEKEENITQISNPDKDKQNERYKLVSVMDTGAKILNKIPARRIPYHIKKIIHLDQMGFSSNSRKPLILCMTLINPRKRI